MRRAGGAYDPRLQLGSSRAAVPSRGRAGAAPGGAELPLDGMLEWPGASHCLWATRFVGYNS